MLAIRSGRWLRLLVLLALTCPSPPVSADDIEADTASCERAILGGAARAGIPGSVLHAISLTETGRNRNGRLRPWPWAINREGEGHWFETRDEAIAFARQSLAEGRTSFDVGCFQINYRWHGNNFPSLEAMFDQDQGADYAARFLRDLHAELGGWSAAAGAYHSRTPYYAGIYRARFDRILATLGDAPLMVASGDPRIEAAAEDTPPRKSRTRMARRPLIITIDPFSGKATTGDRTPSPVPGVRADSGGVILLTRDDAARARRRDSAL